MEVIVAGFAALVAAGCFIAIVSSDMAEKAKHDAPDEESNSLEP